MPTDLKNFIENNRKKQDELIRNVLEKSDGDAARPLGKGIYISGAVAALVGAMAIAL